MIITPSSVARALAAAVLVAGVAACDAHGPTSPAEPAMSTHDGAAAAGRLTVYSQNVYLGGDTGPLFSLDFNDLEQVLSATGAFWDQVLSSDPAGRMAAIADAIEEQSPHLVALQEVFQFTVVDFSTGAPTVTAHLDLLDAILRELESRSLPYELVTTQANTTTGRASGLPLTGDAGTGAVTSILQFADRIAVLRRTDIEVTSQQGRYAADFRLGPLTLTRGWIRATTQHAGTPHHLINTHLETQALAPVQARQTAELLGSVAAGLDGVTILAGDLNSDAEAGPGAPSWTPTYDTLIEAGFIDAWIQSGQPAWDDGLTCCQDPDLRNGTSTLDERIDFVLVRRAGLGTGSPFVTGGIHVEVVGEEAGDRTVGEGLWPSDHAGLVASILSPPGLGVAGL